MEKETVYFPMGLKLKPEIIPGFGKQELVYALIFNAIALVVFLISYAITKNIAMTALGVMGCIFASVVFQTKDNSLNLSFIDHLKNLIRFSKAQKKFEYIALKEWGKE